MEKRTFNRFEFNVPVKFIKEGKESFSALLLDMSLKGASVEFDSKCLNFGDRFEFKMVFSLEEEINIDGVCEVVSLSGKRVNLKFVSVSGKHFDNLKRLLEILYG